MKNKRFFAWILGKDGRVSRELGVYFTFTRAEAKIRAQADAIVAGLDYKRVQVVEETD